MKIQFLFFVLNMHENFRVWPYAHKIKHIFFFGIRKCFRNFWNFFEILAKNEYF